MQRKSRLIVTLPVYRDTSFLEKACEKVEEVTPSVTTNFILLIAEDGSDSSEMVDRLKQTYPNIVYTQNDQRLGRGKALRKAWSSVEGNVYAYLDVDLATDMLKFDAVQESHRTPRKIRPCNRFEIHRGFRNRSAETKTVFLDRLQFVGALAIPHRGS